MSQPLRIAVPQMPSSLRSAGAAPCAQTVTGRRPIPGKTVCLLLVGNQWIYGENDREKTSPQLEKCTPDGAKRYTLHAEERALQLARRVGGKIRKVLVLRWTKAGELTMARPREVSWHRSGLEGVGSRGVASSNR